MNFKSVGGLVLGHDFYKASFNYSNVIITIMTHLSPRFLSLSLVPCLKQNFPFHFLPGGFPQVPISLPSPDANLLKEGKSDKQLEALLD